MKIEKLLIANRGEIAARIIRTCKNLGIKTVVVHAEVDGQLPYLREADEIFELKGNTSSETYLNIEKIIKVATQSGVNAIHPGYGFLSENPDFARQVKDSGFIFIGPSEESIIQMGNKISAKILAQKAEVPLIPGSVDGVQNVEEALKYANSIGFPVLLKAAAGGGGKGMRTIHSGKELKEVFDIVKSEALSSFGNDDVFIEKYIPNPKHVEIQVFGDQHGNCVHLYERDCSIQRRHQKVVEEAPCAIIEPATRKKMCNAALRLAEQCNYYSSGTVEFLMDESQNFYFLEMNTRLQVEHPVTEMITGVDLVEWQIKIAEGQKLPLQQDEINIHGHAIELRIYAEDYLDTFSPSPGTIEIFETPVLQDLRIDSGFEAGNEVTLYFDPMIAKFTVYATNRKKAINHFLKVLEDCKIKGIDTTIPFGKFVFKHHEFQKGTYSIRFYEDLKSSDTLKVDEEKAAKIAALFSQNLLRQELSKAFIR
ncbi:acetyl-CoA carboxylase biotin carboxylase subunit [Membranihabitans maritimus]|uniref:acetyl-CoA carboxylase biotin carboxylase subunit n=1 Tax=Membranihabitans maritimus TaxID=2904244 RepID=UPI001F0237DC|nr:acetyl-CoA carboxylase biotin carboxylase subunit [Membranihabitans maritimus]